MDFHHHCYSLSQKLFRSKIFFGLEVLISSVLGITLVFPILILIVTVNELLRFCFKLYLLLLYEDKVKLNEDECGTNYMLMPNKGRHTILYLGEVEGTLDVQSLRNSYQKHVIENKVYAKLTYILDKNWLYTCLRKCDTFDIKNHVRCYPGTEDRIVTENELLTNILPDLSNDMTDPEKPQWEEVIIPFYQIISSKDEAENESVESHSQKTISLRIIRIHHSYMDGASMLMLIANTFSEGKTFPYVIDPCKPLKIPKLSMLLYKLTSVALFSTTVLRSLLMPPCLRSSRFTVNFNSTEKRLFGWSSKIPMDHFRSIKDKSGVSMPAIASTVLSGAIRKLELKYPLLRGKDKHSKLNKVPPDLQPMWVVAGMFPYESQKPGNEHIVIETQINTSDISSCERLSILNDDLGRLAKNPMVTVFYWFAKILGRYPSFIVEVLLSLVACPVLLSNIPLCTRNVKLWDKECTSIVGWVPLIGRTGLGVVSVRYADHFRYCIQVDSSVVNQEELDYFVSQIEEQVEELFVETANLKRKISTESSSFDHEKGNKHLQVQDCERKDDNTNDVENEDNNSLFTNCINNNSENLFNKGFSAIEETIASANYSFLCKLKDGIEQIRGSVMKIKEQ